jgi:hypothetical protein
MAGKKIKLEKQVISDILIADTDSESGDEVGYVQKYFEEEDEKKKNKNNQPLQKSNHRLQHVTDYQPGDCLKEGIQIFIILSVQQKVSKKVRLHTSTKTAHHCMC